MSLRLTLLNSYLITREEWGIMETDENLPVYSRELVQKARRLKCMAMLDSVRCPRSSYVLF